MNAPAGNTGREGVNGQPTPPAVSRGGSLPYPRSTLAAVAGIAAFGYCILYTAATSSLPLETPPDQVQSVSQPVCEVMNGPGMQPSKEVSLGACTQGSGQEADGAPVRPVSACEAIGGRPQPPRPLTDDGTRVPATGTPLPAGQSVYARVDNAEGTPGTITEVGIMYRDGTIAVCGPLEWSYAHAGQTLTQHLPSDESLGALAEGESYAYKLTPAGTLELAGLRHPDGTIAPLPAARG
ncbi:hypothetical protein [Arthrobacter crusticola]|uniref:hypothetical protein n=1 Tax=Arthrobacter crusticola TaxID=2547960 RepID=UPI001404CA44|nr:hypothetical protein [Arthrobacter crusticola]